MEAQETLNLISKQWCTLEDLMDFGELGRNSALKVKITNTFNKTFSENLSPINLESKIRNIGDAFTLQLYISFLNYLDLQFKNSKDRKKQYYVKETRPRTLITSIG